MNNHHISSLNENELLAAQHFADRAERYGAALDAAIAQFVRERLWKLSVEAPESLEFAYLLRQIFHLWKLETIGSRGKRSIKHQERLVRRLFGSLPEVTPFAQSQQINTINTNQHKSAPTHTQQKQGLSA